MDLYLWGFLPLGLTPPPLCPSSASTVGSFNRQCLSCDLVGNCSYFSASFSHSADFFLLTCEGGSPSLLRAPGPKPRGPVLREWEVGEGADCAARPLSLAP